MVESLKMMKTYKIGLRSYILLIKMNFGLEEGSYVGLDGPVEDRHKLLEVRL